MIHIVDGMNDAELFASRSLTSVAGVGTVTIELHGQQLGSSALVATSIVLTKDDAIRLAAECLSAVTDIEVSPQALGAVREGIAVAPLLERARTVPRFDEYEAAPCGYVPPDGWPGFFAIDSHRDSCDACAVAEAKAQERRVE